MMIASAYAYLFGEQYVGGRSDLQGRFGNGFGVAKKNQFDGGRL